MRSSVLSASNFQILDVMYKNNILAESINAFISEYSRLKFTIFVKLVHFTGFLYVFFIFCLFNQKCKILLLVRNNGFFPTGQDLVGVSVEGSRDVRYSNNSNMCQSGPLFMSHVLTCNIWQLNVQRDVQKCVLPRCHDLQT